MTGTASKINRRVGARARAGRTTPANAESPAAAWRASIASDASNPSAVGSRGIALWRQIAEELQAEIETGRIVAGERLPPEARLAERFGVNRHTVRRAIAELSQLGMIEATPGRGTFVRAPRIAYPIGQSTRFSEIIESSGREPGGRLIAHRTTKVPAAMADWLGLVEGDDVVELDHVRVANDVPICLATSWFPAQRFADIASVYEACGTITKSLAMFGVNDYRRLRTQITCRPANAIERDDLGNSPWLQCACRRVGQMSIATKVPVQVSHTRFAAERVQLVVES